MQARDGAKMERYCAHAGIFSVLRGEAEEGHARSWLSLCVCENQVPDVFVVDRIKWISSSNF